VEDNEGILHGTAAVIDKDLASSLLAADLSVDLFLISTDIDRVYVNYGQTDQIALDKITLADAEKYLEAGEFAPGSMGPKVKAAINYLRNGGTKVIITSAGNIGKAIRGEAGTHISV
jgi:carbamate kinase